MHIEKYGVVLVRMALEDMEIVRAWRNDSDIMKCMFSQKIIGKEEQLAWFSRIDNEENYYFMINYGGQPVGQVSLSKIDQEKNCAESGILTYGQYQGRGLAQKAMLALLDFAFYELQLVFVTALVRADNMRAQKFHMALGYKEIARYGNVAIFAVVESNYQAKKKDILGGVV